MRVGAFILAVTLTMGSCSSDNSDNAAVSEPRHAGTAVAPLPSTAVDGEHEASLPIVPTELAWRSCGSEIECSELSVPVEHTRPTGPTIDLALVRRPAAGGEPLGVIITNPGGPGASGVDWLAARSPLPDAITEHFDIVSWDPRGVGRSAALDCGDDIDAFFQLDSDPDDPAEQVQLDDAADRVAVSCADAAGDLLANMGTDATVQDLELIRTAVGGPLRYVGFSYGTLIGLQYLSTYPDRVESMVLDGVVDPTLDLETFLADQAVAFEDITSRNLAECSASDTCATADPGSAIDELLQAVELTPLRGSDGSPVGPAGVADALIMSAYAGDGQAAFVDALAQWKRDDPNGIVGLADAYRSFTGWGAYLAVICADWPHPDSPDDFVVFADRMKRLSSHLGPAIANELLPCAFWPVRPRRASLDFTAGDPVPVVLIGGTHDPATPFGWAERVQDLVPDGVLVAHGAAGHTAIGRSPCIDDVVAAYLLDGEVPADGLMCR